MKGGIKKKKNSRAKRYKGGANPEVIEDNNGNEITLNDYENRATYNADKDNNDIVPKGQGYLTPETLSKHSEDTSNRDVLIEGDKDNPGKSAAAAAAATNAPQSRSLPFGGGAPPSGAAEAPGAPADAAPLAGAAAATVDTEVGIDKPTEIIRTSGSDNDALVPTATAKPDKVIYLQLVAGLTPDGNVEVLSKAPDDVPPNNIISDAVRVEAALVGSLADLFGDNKKAGGRSRRGRRGKSSRKKSGNKKSRKEMFRKGKSRRR